jgi:hypothetical protein
MDVLALIHYGEITPQEAEHIFDDVIAQIHHGAIPPEWESYFCMSRYEATARLHGASFAQIATCRYDGWPTECCNCGMPLDYRLFGWWFMRDSDDASRLRHITCPAVP